MKVLLSLYLNVLWARIRGIYSKVVPAIITTVSLIFFGAIVVFAFIDKDNLAQEIPLGSLNNLAMLFLVVLIGFSYINVFQKRMVILKENEINYFFVGPFKKKDIMKYIILQNLVGTVLFIFGIMAYLMIFGAPYITSPWIVLGLIIVGLSVLYPVFIIHIYVYLKSIVDPKYRITRNIVFGVIIGLILAVFGYYYFINMDLLRAYNQFINSTFINFIPIFGWGKVALNGLVYSDNLMVIIGILLNSILGIVFSWLVINYKESFVEEAMDNAIWYRDVMEKQKKTGSNWNMNKKVYKTKNTVFKSGGRAIFDKGLLELRKTRNWFSLQEVMLVVIYLVISYVAGMGYQIYQMYIVLTVFISLSAEGFLTEFQKIYIYLLPIKPINKLINMVGPVLMKSIVMSTVSLLLGAVVFQVGVVTFISSFIQMVGFTIIMMAASLWSLRILKAELNPVAGQLIKMFIAILAMVPSMLGMLIIFLTMRDNPNILVYMTFVSLIMNIIGGVLLIYFSKGIFNGKDLLAE